MVNYAGESKTEYTRKLAQLREDIGGCRVADFTPEELKAVAELYGPAAVVGFYHFLKLTSAVQRLKESRLDEASGADPVAFMLSL